MAKSKSRRKKAAPKPIKRKPENLVRKMARTMSLGTCFINSDWQETGLATIVVSRKMGSGKLLVGTYVADIFCLGIKDSFFRIIETILFEDDFLEPFKNQMGLDMVEEDANLIFNIIYGAVEYAEDLGFAPQKDFKLTEYILPPVDAIEYVDVEFGKDGKPFFVVGPNDNIAAIIEGLDKAVGEGSYGFINEYNAEDIEEDIEA